MFNRLKQKIRTRFYRFFSYSYLSQIQKASMVNLAYVMNAKGKKSKVVYTCLTGDYDILPLHEYLDYSYDYICFTDNKN